MSILTECNYCRYQAIVAFQKKAGKRVVKIPSTYSLGGVEVYALKKLEKPNKKNWVAWMMEISKSCQC